MKEHTKEEIRKRMENMPEEEVVKWIESDPLAMSVFEEWTKEQEKALLWNLEAEEDDLEKYTLERLGDKAQISRKDMEEMEKKVWKNIQASLRKKTEDDLEDMFMALKQSCLVYRMDEEGNHILVDTKTGKILRQIIGEKERQEVSEREEVRVHRDSLAFAGSHSGEIFPLPYEAGKIFCEWKENRLNILFLLAESLQKKYNRLVLQPSMGEIRDAAIQEGRALLEQVEREDYEVILENENETRVLFPFSTKDAPYFYPLRLPENIALEKDFHFVRQLACGLSRKLTLTFFPRRLEIEAKNFPQDLRIKVYRGQQSVKELDHPFFSFPWDYPKTGKNLYVAFRYQEKERILVLKFMES